MWCLMKNVFIFMISLKSVAKSCECERSNSSNNTKGIQKANMAIGKRDLEFDDYASTEGYFNFNTSETVVNMTTKNDPFNATTFPIRGDDIRLTTTEDINDLCPLYKNTSNFDLEKMADVWQTAYYRMSERVSCFKIFIRKTSEKERKRLARKYGDFNSTVDWNKCLLEIKSGDKQYAFERKHYLQGNSTGNGILANVILEENENSGNITGIYVNEESADQWLVIKNLLLMRDCENGDVAVFSRVPHQPRLEDVWDALKVFGEEAMNGTLACLEDDRVQRSIKNVLQEVLFRFRLF